MPTYEYQCSSCGHVAVLPRRIEDRDEPLHCPHCSYPPTMSRVPSAPSFTVKGFNARNGYTTTPND